MKSPNYTITIVVNRSPAEVFAAIKNVRAWWSGNITGVTDRLGAEFTYSYKTFHRSTHKITEMSPDERIVWHTTDASINFVTNKREWNDTDIVFEIAPKGNQTELRFTHIGLVPTIECYEGCSGAWHNLISEGLYNLIAKGKSELVSIEDPARKSA